MDGTVSALTPLAAPEPAPALACVPDQSSPVPIVARDDSELRTLKSEV